ncbi:MAG: aldehyde dehydrogenase family protein, partial [Candidatus Sericytochromatia bacterium]
LPANAQALTEKIVEKTRALHVGSGRDPKTEVGPIITEAQLSRIDGLVQEAIAQGATLLTGGHRLPGPGTFYAPTVLTGVRPEMRIMQEELFGPVLPIAVVENEAAMLAAANDSAFGLSATVWTRDLTLGKRLARELRAGTVWVNTGLATYANPLTPRGGFKESGIGKIGGRHGLLEMVRAKVIDLDEHGRRKDWWYPVWPGAYDYVTAGMDLLHGSGVGRKLEGVLRLLRTRR